MALPDSLIITSGTQIVLAQTTDYSPSQGQPSRTDELNLEGLASGGSFRQSAKFDLGINRAPLWQVRAHIEWFSAPTAGEVVQFWIGFSSSATAANDNPANLSGSDAAYNGYGAAAADALEAAQQLIPIGNLVATADTDIQVAEVGVFVPYARYGMIVVRNNTSVNLANTDAAETAVVLTPIEHDIVD